MIAIRAEFPEARIIMLTTFQGDVEIQRALEGGAGGYLLKSMPPKDLVAVIRQVHAGKKHIPSEIVAHLAEHLGEEELTPRQPEVPRQIAGGNRNRDIAERLSVAEVGAKHRTGPAAIAARRGLIRRLRDLIGLS
jgi:DNA-binding NarL/FixJ family response regulator